MNNLIYDIFEILDTVFPLCYEKTTSPSMKKLPFKRGQYSSVPMIPPPPFNEMVASLEGDNLAVFTISVHMKSYLIRRITFDGSGLIKRGNNVSHYIVFSRKIFIFLI